mgnify:CR=1 FL=1
MTPKLSLLYTTFPSKESLHKVLAPLFDKKLIACANILGPITSLYVWEGTCEETEEIATLLKTTSSQTQAVIEILEDLHPYDTPAILNIPIGLSSAGFAHWVQQSTKELKIS